MAVVACSAVTLAIVAIVIPQLPPGPHPWIFLLCFMAIVIIGGLIYKKMEMDKLQHQQLNDKKRSMAATLSLKMSAITKEIEATRNGTKLAVWDSELLKLQNDFDLFAKSKEDIIKGVSDEMGLVKVQYELEAGTKDFQLKLDAAKTMIEQKESTLESINLCGKEVDSFFRNILLNIPDSPDEDFMDFASMEKQIEPLKSDVAACFDGNFFHFYCKLIEILFSLAGKE